MSLASLKRQKGYVRGSGGGGKDGGGGAARAPVESPDSLRSKQFARVLDLISEGEVRGLVNGLKSVYLDNTPIQNNDDSFNFQGVTFYFTPGTQAQSAIPGFQAVESEVAVGAEIKADRPVTRRITNPDFGQVRVTLTTPQLTNQDTSTGDLRGTRVEYAIDVSNGGSGTFTQIVLAAMDGKTTTTYQVEHVVNLTGVGPWDVRVRRITPDSKNVILQNKTFWSSYTGIINQKLRYPNSAIAGLEVDASQFQSIPARAFDAYGLIVEIPVNYDPITRVYTGAWNGTFKLGWTDCPVWHFRDILVNDRYGLGNFIDSSQIDKYQLYAIAQYCDELVDDGDGGTEPRYRSSLYLQTREEAYKLIVNMASIFRGMVFWQSGAITAVSDMPSSLMGMFTPANVVAGEFNYEGTAKNARHTVALVSWNDPENDYKQEVEYVPDVEGIRRYGINETEVVAFGCTSRGQAVRMGKWLLYSERLETETVTFQTSLEAAPLYPGALIQTTDPARAGKRMGGRIWDIFPKAVVIDAPVTIEAVTSYTLYLKKTDGTIVARPLNNAGGVHTVLTFSSAIVPEEHPKNNLWMLSATTLVPEVWRVMAVREDGDGKVTVVGLAHHSGKFDLIEDGTPLEPRPTSTLTTRPPPVENLDVQEFIYENGPESVVNRTVISWTGMTGRYRYQYRSQYFNWTSPMETSSQTVTIDGLEPGDYTFVVTQIGVNNRESPPNSINVTLYGETVAGLGMPTISGLQLVGQQNNFTFTGRHVKVVWNRASNRYSYEALGANPESGAEDVYFKDYQVRVSRSDGTVLRYAWTEDPEYTYTFEMNVEDNEKIDTDGPQRVLRIEVWMRGRWAGQISRRASIIEVSNPQPGPLSGLNFRPVLKTLFAEYIPPTDLDWEGVLLHASTTPGFTPSGLTPGQGTCIYEGKNTFIQWPGVAGQMYYFRIGAYDSFGKYGLTYSSELAVQMAFVMDIDIAQGAVMESHLWTGLGERINLIDGPPAMVGSVAWYSAEEALQRANADGNLQSQITALAAASSSDIGDMLAVIESEATTRAAADAAEATLRETLASQMRGAYTGTDSSLVTTGLIYSERIARATGDSANATSITALQASFTSLSTDVDGIDTRLTQNEAAVTTEQTVRANADSSLATSVSTVLAVANSKNRVYRQADAPNSDLATGDLWFDTDDNNKTYRYQSGTGWEVSDDTRISSNTAAIQAEAIARADEDLSLALSINTVSASASVKNRTYRQTTAPSGSLVTGDVWFDSDDNNKLYRYLTGTGWVPSDDARIAANLASIQTESTARANGDSALASSITTVSAAVGVKIQSYRQTSPPAGSLVTGDIWFDTDDNNKIYRYLTGTGWVASDDARISTNSAAIQTEATARVNGDASLASSITTVQAIAEVKNQTYRQTTAPSFGNTGDLWFDIDDNNKAYRYLVGSGWQPVDDARILANENAIATNTVAIQTEATARASVDGDLLAQYTVKIDINGYVAGFGLASTANNSTPFSEFYVRADRFAVGSPGATRTVPFIVQSGVVYLDQAVIKAASITDAMIVNVSATKIIASSLSSITANIGLVTAGIIQNLDGSSVINLNATGSAAFISVGPSSGTGFRLYADGSALFYGVVISRQIVAASGSTSGLNGIYSIAGGSGWTRLATYELDTGYVTNAWAANTETFVGAAGRVGGVWLYAYSTYGSYYIHWGMKVTAVYTKTRWFGDSTIHMTIELWAEVDGDIYEIEMLGTTDWKLYKVT